MEEHQINFEYSARYYTHGNLTDRCKDVWFVLHGYGQLAKYFIKKFEVLDPNENFIVAPEGTNRFYLKGSEGRIGATWMTREDRETDIRNYLQYLNKLYDIFGLTEYQNVRINVLGFSQGAATVSRWIADGQIRADRIILWAGILPPDLKKQKASTELSTKEIMLVAGRMDPYITPERLDEMKKISQDLNIEPKEIWYDGVHQIDSDVVMQIATFY